MKPKELRNRVFLGVATEHNNPYSTVWAADFETPVGSSTLFSFLFFLGSIGRKNIC
jgi:hypothetical protein